MTVYNGTTAGTWTVSELNNNTQAGGFKLRLSGVRGNSNTAVTWTADYVKVTVDYTAPTIIDGATLSGSSSLAESGESIAPTVDGAVALSGSSTVSAAGTVIVNGAVSLSGASSLAGVG